MVVLEVNLQMRPTQYCPPMNYFHFVHSKTLLLHTVLWVELWQGKKDCKSQTSKNDQYNQKQRGEEAMQSMSSPICSTQENRTVVRLFTNSLRAGVLLKFCRWKRKPPFLADFQFPILSSDFPNNLENNYIHHEQFNTNYSKTNGGISNNIGLAQFLSIFPSFHWEFICISHSVCSHDRPAITEHRERSSN